MPKLTARSAETLKPDSTRQEIPDSLLRGLYFVIQPSGVKSWAVRFRHNGKPRKYTLGPYPRVGLKEARELGGAALRAASEGRDPTQERRALRTVGPNDIESAFVDFLRQSSPQEKRRPRSRKHTKGTRPVVWPQA